MAVRQENNAKRYIGLSSDRKPVPQEESADFDQIVVFPGSTFYEKDTGQLFVYNDGWALKSQDATVVEVLEAILHRLDEMHETLIESVG